jgi:hypothetical protein
MTNMHPYENPREQEIWLAGRRHESEAIIAALTVESLDPNYEQKGYEMYVLAMKVAIEIVKELTFEQK